MALSAFDVCFDRVIGHEGGYSNDPRDPGGETNWGISKRAYPHVDIANLTREGAKALYLSDYWQKMGCDNMPLALAFQVFDFGVNSGVTEAIRELQNLLGIRPDGVVGPVTRINIQNLTDPMKFTVRYMAARLKFMTNCQTWGTFGKGWARRIATNMVFAVGDC